MRALALLGPRSSKKCLDEFRDNRAELIPLDTPTPDEVSQAIVSTRADVALVFGGDGTLNRHLAPLSESGITPLDDSDWFISISNTPTYGGGLKIAPQASISDGHFDITFASSTKFSRFGIARHFPKILSGNHIKLPQLSIVRTPQMAIETERPTAIYADGEYIGQTPCRVLVKPGALKIVQPGS